jgi:hypothetical protein
VPCRQTTAEGGGCKAEFDKGHHACGSPKEMAGRMEERASPNDCQQEVLSRKNGASRKHHKTKQLQQIKSAVRHQGKTKTVNISLFFWAGFLENLQEQD